MQKYEFFPRWQTKSLFFFLPSVKNPEYFPPFGNKAVTLQADMKKSRDNYTFLTHAPVHRVIFTMAIPTIISMLSTSMYNLADTYFVGSINTQSVAAVGVSFAMMAVIQASEDITGISNPAKVKHLLTLKRLGTDILARGDCFTIKDLDISGNDLIEYGLQGHEIGETLKSLLDIVIENPKLNDKATLIAMIEHIK